MSPFLGTRGAGSNRAFGYAGAAAPAQVTGLTSTNVGSGRAFNNGRIDLSWSTPASNGATITGYRIQRSTDGSTYSTLVANTGTTATTYSDTGLSSNQIYYYRIAAINAAGTGLNSTAANATATTVPQAPTIGTATNVGSGRAFNNGRGDVTFTAGATGGSAITGYTVTASSGGYTGTGSASPISVTGLQSGTSYTFTVTATNANGTSTASAASNSITATTIPQAPTIGTATNVGSGRAFNNGAATVAYTANGTGGAAVTYTATASSGGYNASGGSPITVTGLQSATAYTFTVTATNANGSATSAASNSITATTVPQAPTIGTATAGNASATVTYTANATGGAAVSTFTATSSPGGFTGTGASPITVSGLTNGTAYTFTVTATNANGTSAASAASNSVTPIAPANFVMFNVGTSSVYSADGISWTANTVPSNRWFQAQWGNDRYIATAVDISGGNSYYVSTNGLTWTFVSGGFPISDNFRTGTYGNGTWVFTSYNSSNVVRSTDNGATWQSATTPIAAPNPSFGNGYFWATYPDSAIYSTNGSTWTAISLNTGQFNFNWQTNTYGNGVWIGGASNISWIAYSFDMTGSWSTNASARPSGNNAALLFGNGIFVALSGGTSYATSTEGWRNYTNRTLPVSVGVIPKGIVFSNGTFVIMNAYSSSNFVLSSTNGTTWTQRTLPTTETWNGIGGLGTV